MGEKREFKTTPIKEARKSSLMTQAEAAKKLRWSIAKMSEFENEPLSKKIGDLVAFYHLLKPDGKLIVEKYVSDLFMS